jgi:RHS repeat-associated protein
MNRKVENFANRLLASFLIVALLISSSFAMKKPPVATIDIGFQALGIAQSVVMQLFGGELGIAETERIARQRPDGTNSSGKLDAIETSVSVEGIALFDQPAFYASVTNPLPQSSDNSFFNGPLIFTTSMENATKPACGCNGEPTYNQGISLVAQESSKCQSVGAFPGIDQDTGGATVFLHNGEFFLYQVDLEIKGRGFNWKFERKYRSGINFEGPLGHNWEFNYNRRLFIEANGDVIRMDGHGRADRYTLSGDTFTAPAGFYTCLEQNSDGSFVERDKNGTKVFYSAPHNQSATSERPICHMTELRDRNGNRMRFKYNVAKQLVEVIDTLGRSIAYKYDTQGHLIEVEDFSGRKLTFQYDDQSSTARTGGRDLIGVTSPPVIGTPNGNNFAHGKTTRYRYSSALADEKLNHNLVEIIAPNEVATSGMPRVSVEYDDNVNSPNADRVLHQVIGGANVTGITAGGTISYAYQALGAAAAGDFVTPIFQTTVTDRNGNLTEYRFNQQASIVRVREFTNRTIRPGDPYFFETRYDYNKDGEMTRMIMPEGNSVEYVYDETSSSRFQQGNNLIETRIPDARRGGDQGYIQIVRTFEPIFNQVGTTTEPRGNDPSFAPQDGGANSTKRFTTELIFDYQEGSSFAALADEVGLEVSEVEDLLTRNHIEMNLGDVNGDGATDQVHGNAVKALRPSVSLLPDSNQRRLEGMATQPIVDLFQYNQFGQVTRSVDPEGNIDLFSYFPENDPDGDGAASASPVTGPFGYLKETITDAPDPNTQPPPQTAAIRQQFFYDPFGNLIKEVDGRGIATAYSVNQLDQVVEIRRAAEVSAARANEEEPAWDRCTDQSLPECRAGSMPFNYRTRIFYDDNNNLVKREVENRDTNNLSLVGYFVDHEFSYDILDNLVEERREVSENPHEVLVTKYRYDRNENRALVISPLANLTAGPARQPSNIVSSVFDERDLLFTSTRGGETTQFRSLAANADISEVGQIPNSADISTTGLHYDANRNLTKTVDGADNTRDGLREATVQLFDGFDRPVSEIDVVGNQSFTRYDPASNAVSLSRFGPVGGRSPVNNGAASLRQPLRPENIDQPLLSRVESKYDELSRLFERNDFLFDYGNQGVRYHRAPILRDGPLGGSNDGIVVTRYEYDRNSRRTFLIEDDLNTYETVYDGADRAVREIDPEGNEIARIYDDDNNVVKVIETESTQRKDVDALRVPHLTETFTTINFYDWLNRLIRTTDNLGQTTRYEYDSRDNLIRRSDAQHSQSDADLITDPLGRFTAAARINRPGNTMDYFVDGQNRKIAEVHQLRLGGQGKNAIEIHNPANPAAPGNPANPDGLIVIDYQWDANSRLVGMADDGSSPADQNRSIGVIEELNPGGNVTRYVYDDLNRRRQEIFDDGTIKEYTYDRDDNVVRVVDQNGTIMTRTFDGDNRLVQVDVNRASSRGAHRSGGFKDPNLKWQITGTTLQRFEYDGLSRLTLAFDNNDPDDKLDDQPVTYSYDSLGRVLEERQCEFPVSARWTGDNNRVGLTYPNGRAIELTFDKLDRVDTISDVNLLGSTNQTPIADYDYIGPGRVLERIYSNGVRLTHLDDVREKASGFDAVKRVVSHRHIAEQNQQSSVIAGFNYTYDRSNNKLSEVENRESEQARAESYEYDSAYRLTSFARQDDVEKDNWRLDGVGNWAQRRNRENDVNSMNEYSVFGRTTGTPNKSGATTGTIPGTPGQPGRPQLHDDNGNMLDDGSNLYGYDFANRLRRVTRKADRALVAVYSYDAHNRRFQATVTNSRGTSGDLNGTVRYFYDGWREIEERRGGLTQQYVYGIWIDEPLTLDIDANNNGRIEPGDNVGAGDRDRFDQIRKDKRFFYSDDGKGCITALTDVLGGVVERYRYDAYGAPTITDAVGAQRNESAVNNRYLFAGRRFDPESGLYYFRNRYMDPRMGRFIHRVPIGNWRGENNLSNSYNCVGNNPINGFDPYGWVGLRALSMGIPKVARPNRIRGSAPVVSGSTGSPALEMKVTPIPASTQRERAEAIFMHTVRQSRAFISLSWISDGMLITFDPSVKPPVVVFGWWSDFIDWLSRRGAGDPPVITPDAGSGGDGGFTGGPDGRPKCEVKCECFNEGGATIVWVTGDSIDNAANNCSRSRNCSAVMEDGNYVSKGNCPNQ